MRGDFAVSAAFRSFELHHRAFRSVGNFPNGQASVPVTSQKVFHPLTVLGEYEILENGRTLEIFLRHMEVELAEHEWLAGVGRHLRLIVEVFALDDAVRGQLVEVGAAPVAPHTNALCRNELSPDPPVLKRIILAFAWSNIYLEAELICLKTIAYSIT